MTRRIDKTVFISYRRTNLPWALAIYQNLVANGYDVFFDYKSIKSGDFEQIITQNIKGRAHFIIILTPSALKRCNEAGDWLRKEIELAITEKRNIVPLFVEGFSFSSQSTKKYLTGKMARIGKYNGMAVPAEYFDAAMVRLQDDFLNISLTTVLHPISTKVVKAVKAQQAAANKVKKIQKKVLKAKVLTAHEMDLVGAAKAQQDAINDAKRGQKKEISAQEWFEKGQKTRSVNKGIYYYSRAIYLKPDYAEAYYWRGYCHYGGLDDHEGAIKDFNQALSIKPDYVEAYLNLGLIRNFNNDLEGSISDYTEAIRLIPNNSFLEGEAFYGRAISREESNDWDGAIADYTEVILRQPNIFEEKAYLARGMLLEKKKDIFSASADYQKYIDLGGTDARAKFRINKLKRKIKQKK